MPTNPVIKDRLLTKLSIRRQSLDGRTRTLQKRLPMSKEDATYLIAFNEDVKIDDQLDAEILERIGRYHLQLADLSTSKSSSPSAPTEAFVGRGPRQVVVKLAGIEIDEVPGLTAAHARDAKQMAERAYPILYLFENSARDIITRVLEAALGPDWWDEVAWSDIRAELQNRKAKEGKDAWHSKRGASPLAYLDLTHLVQLVGKPKVWPHFSSIFPRENWFAGVIDDLTVSRKVIAHMNPLTRDDIEQVEAGFKKWVKQIRAKADLIP